MKAGAALLLLAVSLAACGGDYNPSAGSGRKAAQMAAVYDVEADYPSLDFPSLSATGLSLVAEIRFDPQPAGAPPGSVTGSVTVREARAGGVVRTFDPNTPIPVSGTLQNRQLDLHPFGPVTVGQQALFVELHGTLSSDSRRFTGLATFSNLAEQGSWSGVKQRRYLITASDFGVQGTATIVTVRFDTQFEVRRDAELVSGDPVAAASGGLPFVVNRLYFDNVQVLDPDDNFKTALQFSTGNGSNPHDALSPAAGKIYVTRYEAAFDDVMVADPGTGQILGSIPLSGFATNSSGTARPDRLVEAGGAVMVTMQNIDSTFRDYGPGLAAFIDPNTDAVVDTITLAGQNPFGPPSVHPGTGEIYVADAGIFPGLLPRELSGGVEVIDPVTRTTRGLLVDDDDAGGNVAAVAVTGDKTAFMVVVDDAGANSLVAFDPATGAVGASLLTTTAFIPEIRYDGDGYLLVPEHDISNPGLRVLDGSTGAAVVRIPLSLPPTSVAILTQSLLEVH